MAHDRCAQAGAPPRCPLRVASCLCHLSRLFRVRVPLRSRDVFAVALGVMIIMMRQVLQHKLVFIETTDVIETTMALENFKCADGCSVPSFAMPPSACLCRPAARADQDTGPANYHCSA